MTITHCLIFYSKNYQGGIQKYVEEIKKRQEKKVKVTILTSTHFSTPPDDLPAGRVRSYGLWQRTPLAPGFWRAVQKTRSDIIHFHSPNPIIDTAAANSRIPFVTSVHNTIPQGPIWQKPLRHISLKLLAKNLQKARKIVLHQKTSAGYLLQSIPEQIWKQKIVEIPPGVDHDTFYRTEKKRRQNILFLAHIRPEKGLHILRQAIPLIIEHFDELLIMGHVTYFSKYFQQEKSKLQKLLGKKLRIHLNPKPDDIQSALQQAGCLVCPSIGLESWNLVLLEAAACATPIVRTDLRSLNWLPDTACYTARAGDPHHLASQINQALCSPQTISDNAWQVAQKYHWQKTADQLLDLYHHVLVKN